MRIPDCFGKGRTVFSFEVFPPRKETPVSSLYRTLDTLYDLHPDFISVTYSAGGSASASAGDSVLEIASILKQKYGVEPLAHITCAGTDRKKLDGLLCALSAAGVENILALRGDLTPDTPPSRDFAYASDLTAYIREHYDLSVSGACYPEGHFEAPDLVTDILNLRKKVDAGCGHLITQLFLDNTSFYAFRERARIAGINVPLQAGIMPVTNKRQIERMVSLCGVSLPSKFSRMITRYEHNPQALLDAGVAYAVDQIVDLITEGVDGIHLYAMNNPTIARRIYESVQSML